MFKGLGKGRLLPGLLSAAAMLAASSAGAQEAAPGVEEIVVTAGRRAERLAEAPVAATVMTRDFIRDANITSLRQIDDYVPNVQFNQLGQIGGTYITIRGIESNPFIVNRAAVYIDGIPIRQPSDQALGFAEQVEVLRGPQGTLYGANTESGLILVRTRSPSDVMEAEAELNAAGFHTGQSYDGRLSLAGPLVEGKLAGALVATYEKADSFVRNSASSIGEPGELEKSFLQGKLRWTPNDQLTVDMLAYASLLDAPGLYEQEFLPIDRALYDRLYGAAFNGGRMSARYGMINDAPKNTQEDEYTAGANARYEMPAATLDVGLSWRKVKTDAQGTDLDLTAMAGAAGGHNDDEESWNLEARLASVEGERLNWVFGLNHYREDQTKILSTLIGPGGLDDYSPAPEQQGSARDYAAFGQLGYAILPDLRLTGGLRYEHARRGKQQAAGALDLGALGRFTYAAEELSDSYKELLPRVSLDWKPMEGLMLYGSVAKGWVPGGFNLAAASDAVDGDYSRYGAESLWTYELGAKLSVMDGRMLLGAAIFQTDADNWQEYNILYDRLGRVASTTLVTSNAAIRTRGLELELTGRPHPTLDLALSFGLVDAEYRDYRFGLGQNFAGNKVKLVPEWDASVSASWRPWRGLFLRGEANATGDTPLHAENQAWQDGYVLLNARIGWEGEGWDVAFYAENITDRYVYTTSAYTNSLFGSDGTWYAGVGQPRVIGVNFRQSW